MMKPLLPVLLLVAVMACIPVSAAVDAVALATAALDDQPSVQAAYGADTKQLAVTCSLAAGMADCDPLMTYLCGWKWEQSDVIPVHVDTSPPGVGVDKYIGDKVVPPYGPYYGFKVWC